MLNEFLFINCSYIVSWFLEKDLNFAYFVLITVTITVNNFAELSRMFNRLCESTHSYIHAPGRVPIRIDQNYIRIFPKQIFRFDKIVDKKESRNE